MSAGRPCGRSSKSLPGITCSEEESTGGGADTTTGSRTAWGTGEAPGASVPVWGGWISSGRGASCACATAAPPKIVNATIARFIGAPDDVVTACGHSPAIDSRETMSACSAPGRQAPDDRTLGGEERRPAAAAGRDDDLRDEQLAALDEIAEGEDGGRVGSDGAELNSRHGGRRVDGEAVGVPRVSQVQGRVRDAFQRDGEQRKEEHGCEHAPARPHRGQERERGRE